MQSIGAYEAKTHLPRLLDRVARGESLTIARHGRPVARLAPVANQARDRTRQAPQRILERRAHLGRISVSELVVALGEGHGY